MPKKQQKNNKKTKKQKNKKTKKQKNKKTKKSECYSARSLKSKYCHIPLLLWLSVTESEGLASAILELKPKRPLVL